MTFISLVVRIVFTAKMILASWVCTDILLLLCCGVIKSEVATRWKKWRVDHNGGSMVNHVIELIVVKELMVELLKFG